MIVVSGASYCRATTRRLVLEFRRLTFDISGRRRAQPFDCPLDGRVRRRPFATGATCLELQRRLAETWTEQGGDSHACSVHERDGGKQAERVDIAVCDAQAARRFTAAKWRGPAFLVCCSACERFGRTRTAAGRTARTCDGGGIALALARSRLPSTSAQRTAPTSALAANTARGQGTC